MISRQKAVKRCAEGDFEEPASKYFRRTDTVDQSYEQQLAELRCRQSELKQHYNISDVWSQRMNRIECEQSGQCKVASNIEHLLVNISFSYAGGEENANNDKNGAYDNVLGQDLQLPLQKVNSAQKAVNLVRSIFCHKNYWQSLEFVVTLQCYDPNVAPIPRIISTHNLHQDYGRQFELTLMSIHMMLETSIVIEMLVNLPAEARYCPNEPEMRSILGEEGFYHLNKSVKMQMDATAEVKKNAASMETINRLIHDNRKEEERRQELVELHESIEHQQHVKEQAEAHAKLAIDIKEAEDARPTVQFRDYKSQPNFHSRKSYSMSPMRQFGKTQLNGRKSKLPMTPPRDEPCLPRPQSKGGDNFLHKLQGDNKKRLQEANRRAELHAAKGLDNGNLLNGCWVPK